MIRLAIFIVWKMRADRFSDSGIRQHISVHSTEPNHPSDSKPPTGKPIEHCALRVEALIDEIGKRGDTVLIPTPCLAELLCVVPDLEKAIGEISRSVAFEPAPFDVRASIELAAETRKALSSGDKKAGVAAGWQEIKFDRQIAAIAKVNGAEIFYTDDHNQSVFAARLGLIVKHTWDLDLPPKYAQTDFIESGK